MIPLLVTFYLQTSPLEVPVKQIDKPVLRVRYLDNGVVRLEEVK